MNILIFAWFIFIAHGTEKINSDMCCVGSPGKFLFRLLQALAFVDVTLDRAQSHQDYGCKSGSIAELFLGNRHLISFEYLQNGSIGGFQDNLSIHLYMYIYWVTTIQSIHNWCFCSQIELVMIGKQPRFFGARGFAGHASPGVLQKISRNFGVGPGASI